MRYAILVLAAMLVGCGQYEWGTVVTVRPEPSTGWGSCIGGAPSATIQLDDGRVLTQCLDLPVGSRIQLCMSECGWSTPSPDPLRK
jgi:hypothetical protein